MTYQFKIRNISTKGMCILVRQNSHVISHLEVGNILDMKYYPEEGKGHIDQSKTEIVHITKGKPGWFEGHYLVGLSILRT